MEEHPTTSSFFKQSLRFLVAVGFCAVGFFLFVHANEIFIPANNPGPAIVAGTGSSFDAPGAPARLIIPAISVDAAVQSVGITTTGDMGIPTNFTDVAWYNRGPRPGMPGSAVIDGHLDGRNTPRAVFYDLGKLKTGDVVEIVDDAGKVFNFKVTGSKSYPYDSTSTTDIFSNNTSKMALNLITCAGDWMKDKKLYADRVVVFTELQT